MLIIVNSILKDTCQLGDLIMCCLSIKINVTSGLQIACY